jgi:hypothetical protein
MAEFTVLVHLSLQCGLWDVVAMKLLHNLIPSDGGGVFGYCTVVFHHAKAVPVS